MTNEEITKLRAKYGVPEQGYSSPTPTVDRTAELDAAWGAEAPVKPTFSERIKTDITNRGKALEGNITATSEESKGENPVVRGVQAAGNIAGAVTDVAGEVTKSAYDMLPDFIKSGISKVTTKVGEVAEPVINEADKKIQDWATAHPEAAKNLESVLKVVKGVGEVAGAGATVAGTIKVANKAPILGSEVKNIPKDVKGLAEKAVTKVTQKIDSYKPMSTTVTNHISSAKETLKNAKPEDIKAGGGVKRLITKNKEDMARQLESDGFAREAKIIRKVDTKAIQNVDDYEKAINNALKPATKETKKTLDLLRSTEDTLTKKERLEAFDTPGRTKVTKLGKTEYLPTETEERAASILSGKLDKNPVKNVPVVKKEIASQGKAVETFLEKNAKPISADTQAKMFETFRTKASKYMTESELGAYDEQMKLFLKQLPGRGGYNSSNFYKGLKEYEKNVASHLARGKEALLDPTGTASAKLSAAKDIRKIVRNTIGDLHPEFKPKMYDLASLYDALDNMIIKAEKTTGNIISRTAKKYPIATGIAGGILGTKVVGAVTGN